MAGEPLIGGEHLEGGVGDAQVDVASDAGVGDGVEVPLEHHVPVALNLASVVPSGDLEPDGLSSGRSSGFSSASNTESLDPARFWNGSAL